MGVHTLWNKKKSSSWHEYLSYLSNLVSSSSFGQLATKENSVSKFSKEKSAVPTQCIKDATLTRCNKITQIRGFVCPVMSWTKCDENSSFLGAFSLVEMHAFLWSRTRSAEIDHMRMNTQSNIAKETLFKFYFKSRCNDSTVKLSRTVGFVSRRSIQVQHFRHTRKRFEVSRVVIFNCEGIAILEQRDVTLLYDRLFRIQPRVQSTRKSKLQQKRRVCQYN